MAKYTLILLKINFFKLIFLTLIEEVMVNVQPSDYCFPKIFLGRDLIRTSKQSHRRCVFGWLGKVVDLLFAVVGCLIVGFLASA